MFKKVSKFLRNLLGSLQGYGCCPNCGDSWDWKHRGDITYRWSDNDDSETGVLICTECLERPTELSAERIAGSLRHSGWDTYEIEEVVAAINSLKGKAV